MKHPHFYFAVAGFYLFVSSSTWGQIADWPMGPDSRPRQGDRHPSPDTIEPSLSGAKAPPWQHFWESVHVSGGQLTIPFKIRPKKENGTFRLTTDVTLGVYIGATKRLNKDKEHYLTIPLTAGLTFININDDNTAPDFAADGTDVVPGLSWSTGIVLQLEQYNIGLIFGKDYASEVGNQWIYHGKLWWSFGLGFSFLK
ncbi:MAG: hypothetical protein KA165_17285 [Saprospiraceae bacterium]|nr:hypothetical protein [Saprospiraceae bacterium]